MFPGNRLLHYRVFELLACAGLSIFPSVEALRKKTTAKSIIIVRAIKLTVISLRHATAKDMASVLEKVFPRDEITADPRSNQLIIRADAATLEEMQALISRLDVDVGAPKK